MKVLQEDEMRKEFLKLTKTQSSSTVIKPSEEEIVNGVKDGLSINDESGLELAKRTSEHIQSKFGITKESFPQSYDDNNGFKTTINRPCDIDSAIKIEKGPVKELKKK